MQQQISRALSGHVHIACLQRRTQHAISVEKEGGRRQVS
jgi:hypothetical protein